MKMALRNPFSSHHQGFTPTASFPQCGAAGKCARMASLIKLPRSPLDPPLVPPGHVRPPVGIKIVITWPPPGAAANFRIFCCRGWVHNAPRCQLSSISLRPNLTAQLRRALEGGSFVPPCFCLPATRPELQTTEFEQHVPKAT